MKNLIIIFFVFASIIACDKKKAGVSGRVVNAITGVGVYNALVSFVQCKENGDNCTEVVIGQVYTSESGDFVIDKRIASKSKTKWITVSKDHKKLAQKDNVGLNDKNIVIEVIP